MKIINHRDWQELGRDFRQAKPFPSLCIDGFLNEDFAEKVAGSYPKFEDAESIGKKFTAVNEKQKIQITDPSHFSSEAAALHNALASEDFINNMRIMSGIEDLSFDPNFSGGGMHLTNSSGLLDVHVDFNYSKELNLYRRLNILIYLNEEWHDDWGGKVELWDNDVKNCIHSFAPKLNRCVIFATSNISYHGVTPVTSPAASPRKSFAIYLYSKDADQQSKETHSTIFKARPDEKLKQYFHMPVEAARKNIKKQSDRVVRIIRRLTGSSPS